MAKTMAELAPSTPSRIHFIEEIKKFKKEHGKKLKDILSTANSDLMKKFLGNPVIRAYLKRDAKEVPFLENHPSLIDANNKDEKTQSDYYELRIYKLMKNFFRYRSNSTSAEFYTTGTTLTTAKSFTRNLKNSLKSDAIYILTPRDVYAIRHILNEYYYEVDPDSPRPKVLGNNTLRFILAPNSKDEHATFICNIIEEDTKKVLASVFINSWSNPEYFKYIEYRFNLKDHYIYDVSQKISEKKVDMTGVIFIEKHPAFEQPVCIEKSIPLIDASHNLQLQTDDANCSLYAHNFLQAIIEMLNQPEKSDEVYQAAYAVSKGDKNAEHKLADIFKNDLKSYLPCYYNEQKQPRNPAEIKKFHLHQRWNIDGNLIDDTVALDNVVIKEEKEPIKPILPNKPSPDSKSDITKLKIDILKPLEDEYNRLLKKQSALPELKKVNYKSRINAFNDAIKAVNLTLTHYQNNHDRNACKNNLIQHLNRLKNNPAIEKYQPYQKLLLRLLNAALFILTGIVPGIVKYAMTNSLFFSVHGQSKNTATHALKTKAWCQA